MSVSLRKSSGEEPQAPLQKTPQRDIYDIVVKIAVSMLMNFIARRLRSRQELSKARKQAQRKVEKLQKKGKEIPTTLEKDALAGLSRGQKKKLAKAAEKKAAKKSKKSKKGKKGKKGKKHHKLVWLLVLVAGIAIAVKTTAKK
jgi:hypothetical protein